MAQRSILNVPIPISPVIHLLRRQQRVVFRAEIGISSEVLLADPSGRTSSLLLAITRASAVTLAARLQTVCPPPSKEGTSAAVLEPTLAIWVRTSTIPAPTIPEPSIPLVMRSEEHTSELQSHH